MVAVNKETDVTYGPATGHKLWCQTGTGRNRSDESLLRYWAAVLKKSLKSHRNKIKVFVASRLNLCLSGVTSVNQLLSSLSIMSACRSKFNPLSFVFSQNNRKIPKTGAKRDHR